CTGHRTQIAVARQVPVMVVHVLEMVDIDHQDAQWSAATQILKIGLVQLRVKESPIGQVGQRVGTGKFLELQVGFLQGPPLLLNVPVLIMQQARKAPVTAQREGHDAKQRQTGNTGDEQEATLTALPDIALKQRAFTILMNRGRSRKVERRKIAVDGGHQRNMLGRRTEVKAVGARVLVKGVERLKVK